MASLTYTIPSPITVGTATTLTPTAGIAPSGATWSVSSGTLPAGLSIASDTGVISGTPTTAGSNTVTILATDGTTPVSGTITITAVNSTYTVSPATSNVVVGTPVVLTLTPTTPPISNTTVTLSDGSGGGTFVPATVSFTAGSTTAATVNYTPAATGSLSITTTNNQSLIDPAATTLTSTLGPSNALIIAGPSTAQATVATTLSVTANNDGPAATTTVTPSDGGAGGTFTPTTVSIPAGSTTAVDFTYTPAAAQIGNTVTITYTNDQSLQNNGTVTLSISNTVSPITYNLPGRIDVGDTVDLVPVANASVPSGATWTVVTGALPTGTTIDSSTGIISGTASTAGNYSFTVMATKDSTSVTGTTSLEVMTPTTITGTPTSGNIGQPYTFTFAVTGDATAVASLASGSTLPNGVSFNAPTMTFSGTPTEGGHFIADVIADGTYSHAEKVFDILIVTAPSLSYTAITNTVGDVINSVPTYSGQSGALTFTVTAGSLPDGLNLNAATGAITGTLATAESGSATIQLVDATGGTATATYTYTVVTALTITMGALTTATGVVESETPVVSGGVAPYAYSIAGDSLSAVTFDTSTGQVTTLATAQSGSETLTITVADSKGTTAQAQFLLTINGKISLAIDGGAVPPADVGQPYLLVVDVTGGAGTLRPTISTGALPAGLSLDANDTRIRGTPTAAGTSTFTLQASDDSGVASLPLSITVNPALTSTPTYPIGVVGKTYNYQIPSTGGASSKTYQLTGTLPDGLTLDQSTGIVSGTPTSPGTTALTQAINDSITAISQSVSITVVSPMSLSYDPAIGYPNTTLTVTPRITGGSGTVSFTAIGMPAGMSISSTTGVITVTSAVTESATITVSANDDTGSYSAQAQITIINHLFATDQTVYPIVGQAFSFDVGGAVTGGATTRTYTTTSTFPAGLSFDAATGTISGTAIGPAATTAVAITVTDTRETQTVKVSLVVVNPLVLSNPPGNAAVGEAYNYQLVITGGTGTQTIAVVGILPPGLTYNATNNTISGVPTTAGTYAPGFSCQDASARLTGTLAIGVGPELGIAGQAPYAAVGLPYTFTPTVTGGVGTYLFSISGNLPTGLSFNPTDGSIFGTPATNTSSQVTVTVTDLTESASLVVGVIVKPALVEPTETVSITAAMNQSFSQSVQSAGGVGTLSYAVTSGAVPPGLSLNATTGVLSGTMTTPGTYMFTVSITDLYSTVMQSYTINVVNSGIPNGTLPATAIDTLIANLINSYLTVMQTTPLTYDLRGKALVYLARATHYLINTPTQLSLNAFWTLHATYKNTYMTESQIFQNLSQLDSTSEKETMAVYTGYRQALIYPTKPLDLSYLLQSTRCQPLVVFLQQKQKQAGG